VRVILRMLLPHAITFTNVRVILSMSLLYAITVQYS
jgi:hypothetical protein